MAFTGIGKAIKDVTFSALTTASKTILGAINELNSNLGKLGGLRFDHQFIPSVTEKYSADNVLTFGGASLYPENFTDCAFLAVLNSTVTSGAQSVYLIIMGSAADVAPAIIRLDGSKATLYPVLASTVSHRVYTMWSAATTIGVHTSLFKLY